MTGEIRGDGEREGRRRRGREGRSSPRGIASPGARRLPGAETLPPRWSRIQSGTGPAHGPVAHTRSTGSSRAGQRGAVSHIGGTTRYPDRRQHWQARLRLLAASCPQTRGSRDGPRHRPHPRHLSASHVSCPGRGGAGQDSAGVASRPGPRPEGWVGHAGDRKRCMEPRRESGGGAEGVLRRAQPDRVIPNLAVLVEQIGEAPAVLDRAALTASSDGKAQAVIHISEGVGLAKQVSGSDNAYLVERGLAATFARPTATERRQLVSTTYNRRIDGEFVPFKKADLVEFEIEIGRLEPFTFTLTTAGSGAVQRISVMAEQSTDVIYVNISHLCSTLPRDETADPRVGGDYEPAGAGIQETRLPPRRRPTMEAKMATATASPRFVTKSSHPGRPAARAAGGSPPGGEQPGQVERIEEARIQ